MLSVFCTLIAGMCFGVYFDSGFVGLGVTAALYAMMPYQYHSRTLNS